jgi:hypothetical protein
MSIRNNAIATKPNLANLNFLQTHCSFVPTVSRLFKNRILHAPRRYAGPGKGAIFLEAAPVFPLVFAFPSEVTQVIPAEASGLLPGKAIFDMSLIVIAYAL